MNLKELKLKFAKFISNFEEIETDKGKLTIDGDAIIGKEVYIISAEGDAVVAPNGEYKLTDGTIYSVIDGMISEIKKPEEVAPATPEATSTEVKAEATLAKEVKTESVKAEPVIEEVKTEDVKTEEVDTFKDDTKKLFNEMLSIMTALDKKVSEFEVKFETIKKTPMAKTIDAQLKESNKAEKIELTQEERIKKLIEFQLENK